MKVIDYFILGGRVKSAIRAAVPSVLGVVMHMEPYVEARVMGAVKAQQEDNWRWVIQRAHTSAPTPS